MKAFLFNEKKIYAPNVIVTLLLSIIASATLFINDHWILVKWCGGSLRIPSIYSLIIECNLDAQMTYSVGCKWSSQKSVPNCKKRNRCRLSSSPLHIFVHHDLINDHFAPYFLFALIFFISNFPIFGTQNELTRPARDNNTHLCYISLSSYAPAWK